MTGTLSDQTRRRIARAFARFWEGGAGPSHRDLDHAFEDAGLPEGLAAEGVKWERVTTALVDAPDDAAFWRVVGELVCLLRDGDYTGSCGHLADAHKRELAALRRALREAGRDLDDEGNLVGGGVSTVAADATTETVPVLREHLRRLQRATREDDPEAVLGHAKDLVESTVKVVLRETGADYDQKETLPRLAKQAQLALKLHVSAHEDVDPRIAKLTKKILSALTNVATSIAEFRNTAGTGHGRAAPVVGVKARHAKMVAGAAIVYCEMLLDTLQDPTAPWRESAR